jgi:hypothetical protein
LKISSIVISSQEFIEVWDPLGESVEGESLSVPTWKRRREEDEGEREK